jgi:UDP-hydrolysing UDP-N-acetyl-D-glucosamine 2-epimerase
VKQRTIGIVTTSRADYGIYQPILQAIDEELSLEMALFVTGAHLSRDHGHTIHQIEDDEWPIAARVPIPMHDDSPRGIAAAMGACTSGFADALGANRPDILLVLGDRYEMHAATCAAVPLNLPIAHVHGGEVSIGAIDNVLRFSLSALSHLHFTATEQAGARLRRMGEPADRVHVTGAPGLDNLRSLNLMNVDELSKRVKLELGGGFALATFHPETRQHERTPQHIAALLAALDDLPLPIVFTAANADTAGRIVNQAVTAFAASRANAVLVESLGTRAYFSAMRHATVMVGNSSSGIIEAASFDLPVVNVGERQAGREQSANVLNAACEAKAIRDAITHAASDAFRTECAACANIYGDGHAAPRIVDVLCTVQLNHDLLCKTFDSQEVHADG